MSVYIQYGRSLNTHPTARNLFIWRYFNLYTILPDGTVRVFLAVVVFAFLLKQKGNYGMSLWLAIEIKIEKVANVYFCCNFKMKLYGNWLASGTISSGHSGNCMFLKKNVFVQRTISWSVSSVDLSDPKFLIRECNSVLVQVWTSPYCRFQLFFTNCYKFTNHNETLVVVWRLCCSDS